MFVSEKDDGIKAPLSGGVMNVLQVNTSPFFKHPEALMGFKKVTGT